MFVDWKVILLGCQYYPKWSSDSMQSLSKFELHFCRNGKIHTKIYMDPQGNPNSQDNLEKGEKIWRFYSFGYQNVPQNYINKTVW